MINTVYWLSLISMTTAGSRSISLTRHLQLKGREPKKLTSMEFSLLLILSDNADRLITKAELFDNVWKDKFTSDGTLNVHIRKLREAVEPDPTNPVYISYGVEGRVQVRIG